MHDELAVAATTLTAGFLPGGKDLRIRDTHQHEPNVCLSKAAALGYGEYRAHTSTMDVVSAAYDWNDGALNKMNERIKDALDPNSILMPGRSGIWGANYRGVTIEQPWNNG